MSYFDAGLTFGQRWPRGPFAAEPAFELPDVGTPGTGTKVTTDSKGRVTALGTLVESDIPAIPESRVTDLVADLAALDARITPLESRAAIRYEPVTNGDLVDPEIVFADGDVVMTKVDI